MNPKMDMETPKKAGYRMPAEWEPHAGTWLSWPKDPVTFPDGILQNVEKTYVQIIGALQEHEKVNVLVNGGKWEEKVLKKLEAGAAAGRNVIFHRIKSVDVWARDYSPIFVKSAKGIAAVKWVFNAWGGKYEDLKRDNETGESIAQKTGLSIFRPGIVLEGGSLDVNGKGALLTTEQCLLNKNRNPKLSKSQIEDYLMNYLGVDKIIWLKNGIEGDDTDGHVDDFARFIGKDTVICASEDNPNDENYRNLKENLDILRQSGLEVVKLPMPSKIELPERRLPVSYANFYIANKAVLLPVFNDKNDAVAKKILESCFPGREIVPVPSRDLVYGYGGIHCATMQQPR
jgi:agmatine deiminase